MRITKSAAILLVPIALAQPARRAAANPRRAVHDMVITRLGGMIAEQCPDRATARVRSWPLR
jgi:hypothetical protein